MKNAHLPFRLRVHLDVHLSTAAPATRLASRYKARSHLRSVHLTCEKSRTCAVRPCAASAILNR